MSFIVFNSAVFYFLYYIIPKYSVFTKWDILMWIFFSFFWKGLSFIQFELNNFSFKGRSMENFLTKYKTVVQIMTRLPVHVHICTVMVYTNSICKNSCQQNIPQKYIVVPEYLSLIPREVSARICLDSYWKV